VTIGADNRVTISPFKDVTVEQLDGDPDFPNIFKVEDDGFNRYKTFLLSYKFKVGSGTEYTMKEELRIKLEEEEEEKFNL
jgi:hypothetical protein